MIERQTITIHFSFSRSDRMPLNNSANKTLQGRINSIILPLKSVFVPIADIKGDKNKKTFINTSKVKIELILLIGLFVNFHKTNNKNGNAHIVDKAIMGFF